MMQNRSYLIVHFTETTWTEFLDAGGAVTGFRETQWKKLQNVRPGDYLLCYLIRVCRFVGVLEVASLPFKDSTPIWKSEVFPCRIKVKLLVAVQCDAGIRIHDLRGKLSIFRGGGNSWIGHVRGPLLQWDPPDADAVRQALLETSKRRGGVYD